MSTIAEDFLQEGHGLHALLADLSVDDWARPTSFKNWTINKVVQHLHGTDLAAKLALTNPDQFLAMKQDASKTNAVMNPTLEGEALLARWFSELQDLSTLLGKLEPNARVPWFGPDMGVKMFGTARQMETWAHGQAVFDELGQTRVDSDRIQNIVVIGVKTYGWTFVNRKQSPPGPAPYVELTAPSGAVWTFNDFSEDNFVEGSAVDFCHVVTQVRNVADVDLTLYGDAAHDWMSVAQCFAGPPEAPPAPGTRLPPA